MFEVYATVDIAAENNKISGNELRDIIYNEAKTYQKIGEHTVDLKEFSITNLEGNFLNALATIKAPLHSGDVEFIHLLFLFL